MRALGAALAAAALLASPALAQRRPLGEELAIAVEAGDLARVKELLETGARADTPIRYGEHTTTPLIKAADAGHLAVVRYLLAQGADVHAVSTIGGETALSAAVLRGFDDVVEALLEAGADARKTKGPGGSPLLSLALGSGQTALADLLRAAGAEPDAEGAYGITPLMGAAGMCNTVAIRWLVANGAAVDRISQKEHGGRTALLTAAAAGQARCVDLLVELGADPRRAMADGATALSQARLSKDAATIAAVEKALARPAAARPSPRPRPSKRP